MNPYDEAAQIAADGFVEWLRQCVIEDATGSTKVTNETQPFGTFWLGRLASQDAVFADGMDSRGDRLDPCSIGMRFCPEGGPPWSLDVKIQAAVWKKDREVDLWRKCGPLTETVSIIVNDIAVDAAFGEEQLRSTLRAITGTDSLAAHIAVTGSQQDGGYPELTVTLVNTSPREAREIGDTHLYECQMSVSGCSFRPYLLEALPDSFRYDRRVSAYGINCGVIETQRGVLTTLDVPTSNRYRPTFWPKEIPEPKFAFSALADDPIPLAEELLRALRYWGKANWGNDTLQQRFEDEHWNEPMLAEAREAATGFHGECDRIERGVGALRETPSLLAAFRDMNAAMEISARGKYDAWRPFQFGFLLANLADLISREGGGDVADVVWFATGGGKTETYLGLLLTAAFLDRLGGKTHGITAWSRFPLRMLSLQQTQRFANALAAAELVRRERRIAGEPFSLGFFVGSGATPNTLKPDAKRDEPDPDDDDMPNRYRLLDRCPFCRQDTLEMAFDHASWTLEHRCTNETCPWPERALPFYVVDDEIYRFLPTVIVGTLDKAANIGMQASMRGFMGAPLGYCSVNGHGHVYARRSDRKNGCLVPGCRGQVRTLPQDARLYGPSFRLQNELHLLRDSLGAIDSHYEALLDEIERNLTGRSPKILASSATLAGYARVSTGRQAEHDLSIPDQLAQMNAWVAARGHTVAAEFIEPGATATDDKRPEFQRMIERVCDGDHAFDAILVHSYSRFFREAFGLEFYVRKLTKHGVQLISITQELGNDPAQQMMRQIIALFDEYQSKENAKHVLRAMKENARQGFWNGSKAPYGYQAVEVERRGARIKKRLVVDDVEAETVRLIFRLFQEGDQASGPMGVKSIVNWLNARGHRTRKGARWGVGPLYDLLSNPLYAGQMRFNRFEARRGRKKAEAELVTADAPAIIEQRMFERVQTLLHERNPRVTPPRVVTGPILLTGLTFCASCGGAMTLRTGTSKSGKVHRYYSCSTAARLGKTACKGRAVPMDQFDTIVTQAMAAQIIHPERGGYFGGAVWEARRRRCGCR